MRVCADRDPHRQARLRTGTQTKTDTDRLAHGQTDTDRHRQTQTGMHTGRRTPTDTDRHADKYTEGDEVSKETCLYGKRGLLVVSSHEPASATQRFTLTNRRRRRRKARDGRRMGRRTPHETLPTNRHADA